jgi:hypothetical protein
MQSTISSLPMPTSVENPLPPMMLHEDRRSQRTGHLGDGMDEVAVPADGTGPEVIRDVLHAPGARRKVLDEISQLTRQ